MTQDSNRENRYVRDRREHNHALNKGQDTDPTDHGVFIDGQRQDRLLGFHFRNNKQNDTYKAYSEQSENLPRAPGIVFPAPIKGQHQGYRGDHQQKGAEIIDRRLSGCFRLLDSEQQEQERDYAEWNINIETPAPA
ncbi:hypothetical protein D3C72_1016140 [compost metagenome]